MYWRGGPNPTADLNVSLYAGHRARRRHRHQLDQLACARARGCASSGRASTGSRALDGPDYDAHLDAVFERLLVNDRCSDLNGTQKRMKEGAQAARLVVRDDPAQRRRAPLRPGDGRLHRLRRPERGQAERAQDLPRRRGRQRGRGRRPLPGSAGADRGRPRRRRRGALRGSGQRQDRPRDRARAAGRGRLRRARVARAAAALRHRRPGGRPAPAPAPLHGDHGRLRRGPARLVGTAAGRPGATSSQTSRTATAS